MFGFGSYGLLHLFFASNLVVFVDRGRKIIPCSREQGTVATPLVKFLNYKIYYFKFISNLLFYGLRRRFQTSILFDQSYYTPHFAITI